MKRARCDRTGELVIAEMCALYARRGIRLKPTAAHTPQQNGKAERLYRTRIERVRSMLAEAGLGEELWAEALMAVLYTRSRAATSDEKATPYQCFYGEKPDVACLRVWGSPAYALNSKGQQMKQKPKAMLGRVVGYAAGGHAYRAYNPASRKVMVRRDVDTDETVRERGNTSSPPTFLAPNSGAELTTKIDDQSKTTTETPDCVLSQPEST